MTFPLIAGNWKMNTTLSEAMALTEAIRREVDSIERVDKLICPPFISLSGARERLAGSSVKLGAQNLYFEEKGAFTGEISPLMLAGLCEYVILGHSERRGYFQETSEVVNKKIAAALRVGLKPILCVGENLEENRQGQTEAVLSQQVNGSLSNIASIDEVTIAYEPVWAIGTGMAATSKTANDTIGFIRNQVRAVYGEGAARKLRILYGGSVNPANVAELMCEPEINGALVGGASLNAADFTSLVQKAAEAGRSE